MSIQAMAWAFKQRQIKSPTQRYVLLCLANYAGEDGHNAFPSVKRLCDDSGLKERAVRKALRELEAGGFIAKGNQAIAAAHIERPDHRPTVYSLIVQRGAPNAPRESNGVHHRPNGVHVVPPRGAPRAPDPSVNHQLSGEAGAAFRGAPPGTLQQRLGEREKPPVGRQPDFDSEFRKRFGCDPL